MTWPELRALIWEAPASFHNVAMKCRQTAVLTVWLLNTNTIRATGMTKARNRSS